MNVPATHRRFTTLLAATAVATYALLASGAATTTTGAGTTCATWPACSIDAATLVSPGTLLAVGHRGLALLVGGLLALTLVHSWRGRASQRVRFALVLAAGIYLAQITVGAVVVLSETAVGGRVHLLLATGTFSALLFALGWALVVDEGADADGSTDGDTLDGPGDGAPDSSVAVSEAPSDRDGHPDRFVGASRDSASSPTRRIRRHIGAYLELTKPRLLWLLCLLALAGMGLATIVTGRWPDGLTVVATLGGGVLAVGASGTFNHVLERDRDRRMARTAERPMATGRVTSVRALAFGIALLVASMATLWWFVTPLATGLTFAAVVYYSVVYTVILKPNTTWNIAIGGGAGALPAVIGWAAVTGSVGLPALVLAGLIVLWTPAHFYNLAIVHREDYARAGYPMLPVVSGVAATRRRIVATLGATLLSAAALVVVTPLGTLFTVAAVFAGALFLWSVVAQCRKRTEAATMRTFYTSNAYLGIVLLAILVEAAVTVPMNP